MVKLTRQGLDNFGEELSTGEVRRPATPRTLPPLSASPREETVPAVNRQLETKRVSQYANRSCKLYSFRECLPLQRPRPTDEIGEVTPNESLPREQVPAFSSDFEGTVNSINENTVVIRIKRAMRSVSSTRVIYHSKTTFHSTIQTLLIWARC